MLLALNLLMYYTVILLQLYIENNVILIYISVSQKDIIALCSCPSFLIFLACDFVLIPVIIQDLFCFYLHLPCVDDEFEKLNVELNFPHYKSYQ